jgi:hypothetical protein
VNREACHRKENLLISKFFYYFAQIEPITRMGTFIPFLTRTGNNRKGDPMTPDNYDHEAFIARMREQMKANDAFVNQFENSTVGTITLFGGHSIHTAIKAGLSIKPEYLDCLIENPNLGNSIATNFEFVVHENEAS